MNVYFCCSETCNRIVNEQIGNGICFCSGTVAGIGILPLGNKTNLVLCLTLLMLQLLLFKAKGCKDF